MCTLVILRRPGHDWPLLLAANRDEQTSRPSRPPAGHWPDRPGVVAGLDELSGGSWLGVNEDGVVAAVLNRVGTLGPKEGKRSRGELVLEALDHADAAVAAEALGAIEPAAYRSFNLVIADNQDGFWLRSEGGHGSNRRQVVEVRPLPVGLSMVTAHDLNDRNSPRIARYLPRFKEAETPDPARDDWHAWQSLMADTAAPGDEPRSAMTIVTGDDYGTVSSSLLALPATDQPPVWLYAPGRPDRSTFSRLDL